MIFKHTNWWFKNDEITMTINSWFWTRWRCLLFTNTNFFYVWHFEHIIFMWGWQDIPVHKIVWPLYNRQYIIVISFNLLKYWRLFQTLNLCCAQPKILFALWVWIHFKNHLIVPLLTESINPLSAIQIHGEYCPSTALMPLWRYQHSAGAY